MLKKKLLLLLVVLIVSGLAGCERSPPAATLPGAAEMLRQVLQHRVSVDVDIAVTVQNG